MPAPTATNSRLFGMARSRSRLSLGPDHRGGDEAGRAGGQVDDVAAGEVQSALAGPVAAAPEQERVHAVRERDPQRHEDQPDLEADPADHAADEQDRGDGREHELEVDHRRRRYAEARHQAVQQRDVRLSLQGAVPEDRPRITEERADQRRAEAQLVAPQHPDDQDQAEGGEHHHHGVDRPFPLDEAAVQHGQGRDRHQPDQRGSGHLPGVIPGVKPEGIWIHYASRGQSGLRGPTCWLAPPRPLRIPARHVSHARVSGVFLGCYAAGNECGGRYLEMSRMIAWSAGRCSLGFAREVRP